MVQVRGKGTDKFPPCWPCSLLRDTRKAEQAAASRLQNIDRAMDMGVIKPVGGRLDVRPDLTL